MYNFTSIVLCMYNRKRYDYVNYFQTLIAPSLLLDIKCLWFNLTEANDRIESRWQPAESVAAAASTALAVSFDVRGRLFVSYFFHQKKKKRIIKIYITKLQW